MLDDIYNLRDRARQALNRGDLDGAANALVTAAHQTHIAESDYVSLLRPLVEVLTRRNDFRSALTVGWYLTNVPEEWKRAYAILERVPPVDRARTLAAGGEMEKAAREMENAGLVTFGRWIVGVDENVLLVPGLMVSPWQPAFTAHGQVGIKF